MVNQAPPVNWRERSGAGATTAPHIEPLSRSEGDLARNSYRASQYPRMATRAVVNDDGTPISAATEALLERILALTESMERRETDIKRVVDALIANGKGTVTVSPVFHTGLIPIPGIVTGAAYAVGDAFGTIFTVDVPEEGTISNVVFADLDDEGIQKDIVLFSDDFNDTEDNSAFAVGDGDLLKFVGVVSIDVFYNFANNQIGSATPALNYRAPKKRLWGQVVTRGTDNIAAGHQPQFFMVIV